MYIIGCEYDERRRVVVAVVVVLTIRFRKISKPNRKCSFIHPSHILKGEQKFKKIFAIIANHHITLCSNFSLCLWFHFWCAAYLAVDSGYHRTVSVREKKNLNKFVTTIGLKLFVLGLSNVLYTSDYDGLVTAQIVPWKFIPHVRTIQPFIRSEILFFHCHEILKIPKLFFDHKDQLAKYFRLINQECWLTFFGRFFLLFSNPKAACAANSNASGTALLTYALVVST